MRTHRHTQTVLQCILTLACLRIHYKCRKQYVYMKALQDMRVCVPISTSMPSEFSYAPAPTQVHPPPLLSAVNMRSNRSTETWSLPQNLSVCTLRNTQRIIFLLMNSGAMSIHHKYVLMGINYGCSRVVVASGGFLQVSGGPMSDSWKTAVKSKSDVCVCVCFPVGMWQGVMGTLQAKGGRLS